MTTQSTTDPTPTEQLFPLWYHEINVNSLTTTIDGDVTQREALVAWIADIDTRVTKNLVTRSAHRLAIREGRYAK